MTDAERILNELILNVGKVTAYADAVAGGYTGTREEWEEALAGIGSEAAAALAAKNAAEAAQTAAETAQSAAETAAGAAGTAASSAADDASDAHIDALAATAAKEAAETAQLLAEDAKASAIAAKGAAETAQGKAEDAQEAAEAAQAAAETAQAAAETAETNAETAQGKAEDAQAAAEAVLESIPEDYSAMSADVTELKSAADKYVTAVPDEYIQLSYLEADATQYMSTSIKANQNTRFVCRFQMKEPFNIDGHANYVLGSRQTSSIKAYAFFANTNGKFTVNHINALYPVGDADTLPHTIDLNKNNFYLDGNLKAVGASDTFETNHVIYLFGCRTQSGYFYGKVKIFSAQIYNDGVLIADFKPCKRISDGVCGMYNLVSGEFKTPSSALISGDKISIEGSYANADSLIPNIHVIPDYVKTEADRVADKVRNVQTGISLSFVAVSDMHYNVDDYIVQDALTDMRDAIKEIASQTHIDFYTSLGDIIYRLRDNGDYDKGKEEAINMTKLLNDCFGNNDQIRIVGNHDPNAEGSTGYFTAYQLNSFIGAYSNMLTKGLSYADYGYHDFETQKIRLIILNTSFYNRYSTPSQGATQYSIGSDQAYWLCQTLDISDKSDAANWKIMIMSHCNLDYDTQTAIGNRTDVINAYVTGTTWTLSNYSYNFSGKNVAPIVAYFNGHWHQYRVDNLRYLSGETVQNTFNIPKIYIANALPDRDYESMDGITYSKTPRTKDSTAFQIITISPGTQNVIYSHHYGPGIDYTVHYMPQTITSETALATSLTNPAWSSNDTAVATVSNGTVTPVAAGNTIVWAKSDEDNMIECWNITVSI